MFALFPLNPTSISFRTTPGGVDSLCIEHPALDGPLSVPMDSPADLSAEGLAMYRAGQDLTANIALGMVPGRPEPKDTEDRSGIQLGGHLIDALASSGHATQDQAEKLVDIWEARAYGEDCPFSVEPLRRGQ